MQIVTVWTSSDSYLEFLIDDDGNIVGVIPGGNRGPRDAAAARAEAGEPIRVERDTTLGDITDLLQKELRRATAAR